MNNNEMRRFRDSFRGYNKDDVNQYIEQIFAVFSRKEADYKARIAELTSGIPTEKSDVYRADTARLKDAESEIECLKQQLEEEKNRNTASSESEEKSKLYDSMSSQVGNILIVANSNADKIIEEAKAQAERIVASAENERREMLSDFSDKLRKLSVETVNEYTAAVDQAKKKLSDAAEELKSTAARIYVSSSEILDNGYGKEN